MQLQQCMLKFAQLVIITHCKFVNMWSTKPQNHVRIHTCSCTRLYVCMFACLPVYLEHNKSCWHAGGVPIPCTSTSIRWVMTCHALSWSLVKAGPSAHMVYGGCGCRQVCMECVSEHTCMDCFHCMCGGNVCSCTSAINTPPGHLTYPRTERVCNLTFV